MSQRGKGQVQRDAEIRLSKLEVERGELEVETIKIIIHDFNPGGKLYPGGIKAEDAPHIYYNKRTGKGVEIILVPYTPEDEATNSP